MQWRRVLVQHDSRLGLLFPIDAGTTKIFFLYPDGMVLCLPLSQNLVNGTPILQGQCFQTMGPRYLLNGEIGTVVP